MKRNYTLRNLVDITETALLPVSGDVARYEAECIVMHVTGVDKSRLFLEPKTAYDTDISTKISRLAAERLTGKPLAYVLEQTYFFNTEITVSPSVLIPRPDTEILVEQVLLAERSKKAFFCDIGTGSGAITAALLKESPDWRAAACDISFPALETAFKNIPDRRHLVCMDCLSAFKNPHIFDFAVSNPPYIKSSDIPLLENDVKDFEPHMALDGGLDGLDFYRIIAFTAVKLLKPNGRIYCEIGSTQGEEVSDIFINSGWKNTSVKKDLAGRERVFSAIKDYSQ